MRSAINQRKRENRETISVAKAQVTISNCMNFAEGIVPTRFTTAVESLKFETFCVSFFAVTENFLFSKILASGTGFKNTGFLPASAKLAAKYRPGR